MRTSKLLGALFLAGMLTSTAAADTLTMKDGMTIDGIIKSVVKGQVVVEVGSDTKVYNILMIDRMDFTTPHLVGNAEGMPIEHFLKDVEAQEIVENLNKLDKTADEIEKLIAQIRKYWKAREPISPEEKPGWEAAKETFRGPLSRYQEVLNDLYFHVLAKVDEYNVLMKAAGDIYVGVKGPFDIGSALVPREMRELPLRKYVPGAWYDTIYYDGYNMGYDEAYTKYNSGPKE